MGLPKREGFCLECEGDFTDLNPHHARSLCHSCHMLHWRAGTLMVWDLTRPPKRRPHGTRR